MERLPLIVRVRDLEDNEGLREEAEKYFSEVFRDLTTRNHIDLPPHMVEAAIV